MRRLTRRSDIQQVGREGRKIRGRHIELRFVASPQSHSRVAIVVPRHGHSVVERNRVRRLLREHLRITLLNRLPACDIVLRVLPSAYATNGLDLRNELTEVVVRLMSRTL